MSAVLVTNAKSTAKQTLAVSASEARLRLLERRIRHLRVLRLARRPSLDTATP